MIQKSMELKLLEELDRRCFLDNRMKGQLIKARLGYEGELDFEDVTKNYLAEEWILLHDLTFKKASRHLQLDYVLITPHGIYIFEIKNFKARYKMESNKLVSEYGTEFRNIFYQIERGEELLRDLVAWEVPVRGRIVFMSDQDTVSISEGVHKDDYLKRWQLEHFFNQLRENEKQIINVEETAELILSYTCPSHEGLEFEGSHWVDQARKGIICEHCNSGQWRRISRFHIECQTCGHIEAQKRAIFRTITEFQILHYQSEINLSELEDFFEGRVNYQNLRKIFREFRNEAKNGLVSENLLDKKFRYHGSACICGVCVRNAS